MKHPPFFEPGFTKLLGSHRFEPAEIIRFATKFDPQPFHLDEEAAKNSVFGGLCASGWHTASMWMRKHRDFADAMMAEARQNGGLLEYGPSPGISDLKWLRPVFAGETVDFHTTTVSIRDSGSKPGWKVITERQEAFVQGGPKVLEFTGVEFVRCEARV